MLNINRLQRPLLTRARMSMNEYPKGLKKRLTELEQNYAQLVKSIENEAAACSPHRSVSLVAVSKFHTSADILSLYNVGVRHFGENYVQELLEKSKELPLDIKWHFIGGLQSGKCKDLANNVSNLYSVETIDSLKKCKKLDTARQQLGYDKISVLMQVNTSGEEQKWGFSATQLDDLYETIEYLKSPQCKSLELSGLMTIGNFTESMSPSSENKDFTCLYNLKQHLDSKYDLKLKLSMGMSNDYLQAIRQGSDSVRVGSKIFGTRPPK